MEMEMDMYARTVYARVPMSTEGYSLFSLHQREKEEEKWKKWKKWKKKREENTNTNTNTLPGPNNQTSTRIILSQFAYSHPRFPSLLMLSIISVVNSAANEETQLPRVRPSIHCRLTGNFLTFFNQNQLQCFT